VIDSKQYEVRLAKQSGGKAGKGRNKTSTVQVLYRSCIVKLFRFDLDETGSFRKAWDKAKQYVKDRSKP